MMFKTIHGTSVFVRNRCITSSKSHQEVQAHWRTGRAMEWAIIRWIYMESRKWLMIDVTDVCYKAVWRELFSGDLFETFLAHFNSQNRLWFNIHATHSMCSRDVFMPWSLSVFLFVRASSIRSGDQGSKMVSLVENLWICVRCQCFSARKSWVGPFLRCSSWNVCEKFVLKSNVNMSISFNIQWFRYIQIIQHFDLLGLFF